MTTTFHEKGRVEGKREVVRALLECRFGELDAAVVARLSELSADQLHVVARQLLTASSLEELEL
jgi:hypothetical protein